MLFNKLIESSYLARYILLNSVDITDKDIFPVREIHNTPPVFYFLKSDDKDTLIPLLNRIISVGIEKSKGADIDQFLEHTGTTAFLVIQNDKLLFERYYNGYGLSSIFTSFSTVKSFVSALIGISLQEGLLRGLDDPLTTYLPELLDPHWSHITIRHLISMSSGLKYNSHGFLPWDDDPRLYYSLNLRRLVQTVKPIEPPGLHFQYNNYNLVLLGMILERVSGSTVSHYLQEKIWKPLGMESPASWSLDSTRCGMEKMESGLNALAIDFAKFGRLYLNHGAWNGRQVVPESWVTESTTISPGAKWSNYKYLWWIPESRTGRFMAVGNLGQFIFVAPDKDCLILRFGRAKPNNWQHFYPHLFALLVEQL
jgi:CubicO group peptidase (beta-lactamase class C family)